jgi:ABC-type transport system substrate-binding protein
VNVPAYNKLIDKGRSLPLGAARNAIWAKLDAMISADNAPWIAFMNRQWPKFVSPHLQGLVFNGTYFELFPSMVLTK